MNYLDIKNGHPPVALVRSISSEHEHGHPPKLTPQQSTYKVERSKYKI